MQPARRRQGKRHGQHQATLDAQKDARTTRSTHALSLTEHTSLGSTTSLGKPSRPGRKTGLRCEDGSVGFFASASQVAPFGRLERSNANSREETSAQRGFSCGEARELEVFKTSQARRVAGGNRDANGMSRKKRRRRCGARTQHSQTTHTYTSTGRGPAQPPPRQGRRW
ncbi:hypothetical protein MRX96_003534 [Rhipicephalus microplus]